jgi:hypothetical protein
MGFHDGSGNRKAEAHSLRFRRVEGRGEALGVRNSRAVVDDGDDKLGPAAAARDRHLGRIPSDDRFASVADEVHEHLPDLNSAAIGEDALATNFCFMDAP